MYRTPGSNIDSFINWVAEKFTKTNHKTMFICGDYNIDLLNPNKHRKTDEFINTLYSLSLYPKITRPSRITSHCATLIDNIFTNVLDNNIISGLLINDITDHLPVFIVYNCNYNKTSKDIRPLQRQSAVTTPTLKLRKMPSKYSYWPAKPVSGTIVVILSINTFYRKKNSFCLKTKKVL